ncbi:hypothetical protein MHK_009913 [Candidatus Magnetomorum sp. HK-1]|nr:hypothetical protein MHK_009913 [Candidatus Magnetomorum sp. HK-1]
MCKKGKGAFLRGKLSIKNEITIECEGSVQVVIRPVT